MYRLETQMSLDYSTPNLKTLPSINPLFALNKNKTLMFVLNGYDKSMLLHIPTRNQPKTYLQTISKWANTQAIASLPDLSIIALYPRDSNNIIFYINKNYANTGKAADNVGMKQMSLSELPKSLQKKRIVDLILLDCRKESLEYSEEIMMAILFEGGDILKVFIDWEELLKIDSWSLSLIEMPSNPFMMMLITLLLILFPLLMTLRILLNRDRNGARGRNA
eukprot:TRINITY_DN2050_c0_g3_i8.p1 TRINITY_DN2050_c0_g3~~TRINITY_DN2050_c0_g3_i8.p1  ORF type:complete len:221 (+),score=56.00 TRINITY_DN2050_c0_g3_i8:110-772(+)